MTWIVRLRDNASGRIVESATFVAPGPALDAYRALLAREDLSGRPFAAVFKPPAGIIEDGNISTLFSSFDREIGRGRIAPDDPRLDPMATREEADTVANSPPPVPAPSRKPHDWEADERPIRECLKQWQRTRGTRAQAAADLRVPLSTYNGWADGRPVSREAMVRRLMTLIDRDG